MKILWISKSASFVGGAERSIADVAPLLAPRGGRNFLLYDANAQVDPEFVSLFEGAFPLVDVERQIRDIRPDILYVHQLSGKRVTDALSDTGVPIVRFFHDHAPFCLHVHKYTTFGKHTCVRTLGAYCIFPCLGFINKTSGFPPVRIHTLSSAWAELESLKRFNAFAVGSVYMKDHVVAHGFSPASVRVLPMFSPAWEKFDKSFDKDADAGNTSQVRQKNTLLFVGALLRGKGLDTLLEAMSRLPSEIRLKVAGGGAQEGMFREQVTKLGLGDRVEFLGKIKRIDLENHYRTATCVVVPSRDPETFGLVGLEALRHATPVVASRVGGTGEWLLEGVTGYGFTSGDSEALAAAIAKVIGDPVASATLGEAGRNLAMTRFTAEKHADALWNLLESTIRTGRSS